MVYTLRYYNVMKMKTYILNNFLEKNSIMSSLEGLFLQVVNTSSPSRESQTHSPVLDTGVNLSDNVKNVSNSVPIRS